MRGRDVSNVAMRRLHYCMGRPKGNGSSLKKKAITLKDWI
jgi:hypothetical protein